MKPMRIWSPASAALAAAGNRDHTLVIVPEADHELETVASPRAALGTESFAPGVGDQMIAWLVQRVPRS